MKNTPIKLNHLVEEFHYFEDNQVLTATHLNTVVDFLDRRDRMTRTHLIGTGIVCGLDVSFNNSNKTITISKGTAITSDGDLLHIDNNTTFTNIKLFEDEKAKYELFQNNGAAIPLFQLFTAESEEENTSSMRGRNNPIQNFGEMVLVLYLNSFLETPEDCTEVDCDNQGMRQRAQLIPLLIAQSDLDRINNRPQNPFFSLPEMHIQRVNFHQSQISHEENLLERFRTTISNSSAELVNGLVATCGARQGDFLRKLITPIYANPSSVWRTRLNSIFGNVRIDDRPDALYVYNFMKDLTKAYDEFKETIFDLGVECSPEANSHPKHIMVREIMVNDENVPPIYRHQFLESPALNHQDRRVKKAQHLHQRINAMIQHFSIPNPTLSIKITPSKNGDYVLGEQSIPFYYNSPSYNLHRFWSYEKNIRNQSESILGYRATRYSNKNSTIRPLRFSYDKSNFYRIEGVLGKSKKQAESQLNALKKQHNLNFNIISIQIQDEIKTILPPRMRFPAVDLLFHHYREEFKSNVKTVNEFNSELLSKSVTATSTNTPKVTMQQKLEQSKVAITSMNSEMNVAKNQVQNSIGHFSKNYVAFKTNYQKAAVRGDLIHKNVYEYTQTKYETPMQNFVLNYKFNRFDGLIKYFRKKKQKVKEQYIFDNFYNQNTGLESLGGVPIGGTLVLVYVSAELEKAQRVVADFCLPSCCVIEVDPEVKPEEISDAAIDVPVILEKLPPIRFVENIGLYKYPAIKSVVDFKVQDTQTLLASQIQTLNLQFLDVGFSGAGTTSTGDFVLDSVTKAMELTATAAQQVRAKGNLTPKDIENAEMLESLTDKSAKTILIQLAKKEKPILANSAEAKVLAKTKIAIATLIKGGKMKETLKEIEKIAKGGSANKDLIKGGMTFGKR